MVGLVKTCLTKTLGRSRPTVDTFQTLLHQAEWTVNCRPLSYTHNSEREAILLRPIDFIIPQLQGILPREFLDPIYAKESPEDPDYELPSGSDRLQRRLVKDLEKASRLIDLFWQLWRDHYLLELRREFGKAPSGAARKPQVDDIVLIFEDNTPRSQWRLGRILDLITDSDGVVRTARIRLSGTGHETRRALAHLYPIGPPPRAHNSLPNAAAHHSRVTPCPSGYTLPDAVRVFTAHLSALDSENDNPATTTSDKPQQQDPATTSENQQQQSMQKIAPANTGEVHAVDAPQSANAAPAKGSSEPTSAKAAPATGSSVPTSANAASSKGSSELTSTKNPDGFRIPTIVAACPVPILKGAKWRQLQQPKGSSDPTRQHQPKGPSGPTCHASANYSTSDTSSVSSAHGFSKPSKCTGPSGPKKSRPAGGLPITPAGYAHIRDTAASTGNLLYVNDAQMRLHVKAEQQPNNYGTGDHMVLPTEDAGATQRRNEPSGSVRDLASILDTFKPQPLTNCSRWSICVPGPNKTGWEPLKDCRDHIRNERPHLRIEEAIPCCKTICKIKGARRPQCATVIGRLSISSFGKMYAILWASRHHLKPKLNPEDASESRRTNEVVLDFINSVARSRSSELPELVNRYFDVIRDGFTDEPFMPYDFQTATMRWQDGCPTAAAFLKAHPSGPVYFQPDFLNRCRRDIREAYLRVAEPGFIEALEWTRMRNYQVLMQFQRPWTPLRELSKVSKDLVIKVHVNQDNILQDERVVFCVENRQKRFPCSIWY